MSFHRNHILDWADQGRIKEGELQAALRVADALPGNNDWKRFLDRLLLFMGVIMLAAGIIFFFAFNWQGLGRMAKFGLVELPIAATPFFIWRLGVEGLAGKALLLFVSLLTGALLALVGQTYQTGADTFELFATWALAILPWTVIARFPALWILWLALANTAWVLYFTTFRFLPDSSDTFEALLWQTFSFNTVVLALWEGFAAKYFAWLRERWAVRLVATASAGLITILAAKQIISHHTAGVWGVPAWLGWTAAIYFAYQRLIRDLYVVALGVLAAIIVITVGCARIMGDAGAGALLFIGLVVIGLSAAGGYWLKLVASREKES